MGSVLARPDGETAGSASLLGSAPPGCIHGARIPRSHYLSGVDGMMLISFKRIEPSRYSVVVDGCYEGEITTCPHPYAKAKGAKAWTFRPCPAESCDGDWLGIKYKAYRTLIQVKDAIRLFVRHGVVT